MHEDEEPSPRELEQLEEDELYIKLAFQDDRFMAAVLEIERLRNELAVMGRRMNGLMDEKAELVKHAKNLQKQLQRKLKPNTSTRERKDDRPF
jgi:hypothetical protein